MKNRLKALSLLTATALLVSSFAGMGFNSTAYAKEAGYKDDNDLSANGTEAPTKDDVLPDDYQYEYMKEGIAAFCHFGPNTFNNIEWGENYGSRPPSDIFTLSRDFDADGFVQMVRDTGYKKICVTAKHHDGFCIWNSAYTEYDIASTNYKDGQGDILKELSQACSKYDIDMGLYLSPWDIHEESYGYRYADGSPINDVNQRDQDAKDYNEFYDNQLKEILSNPEYGNKGVWKEVWMDGAKGGNGNADHYTAQIYDFTRFRNTIQTYQGKGVGGRTADCMLFQVAEFTTVTWIGNEGGNAGKDTWAKINVDSNNHTYNFNKQGSYSLGFENGNQWSVPEADTKITSGWFWGPGKKTPKSITDLANMYFNSVGHNAVLLLNIPPNTDGTVDDAIKNRSLEFGQNIRESFSNNLAAAQNASISVSSVRGDDSAYKPSNMVDANDSTYWTTSDGTNTGTIVIDLGQEQRFDCVSIEEAIRFGQRINSYTVEVYNSKGEWERLDNGVTIGAKRLIRTGVKRGTKVRITVSTPSGKVPMIDEVGVYKLSKGFELPGAAPEGMEIIDNTDSRFTLTGTWKQETGSQYTNGTSMFSQRSPGASATLSFHGSKVYILGTIDSSHGAATISIDNGAITDEINTSGSPRKVGQILYTSPDLEDGNHTITITAKTTAAVACEAAYVINNGGKGMIGIEENAYTMYENERIDVNLVRVGGSTGSVSLRVEPNPDTAFQGDFETELIHDVTFEDGETVKTITAGSRRNDRETGDLRFTLEMSSNDDSAIFGFNTVAAITIKDTEGLTAKVNELRTLVNEGKAKQASEYESGFEEYSTLITEGDELLGEEELRMRAIIEKIDSINEAKNALVAAGPENIIFPSTVNGRIKIEAEDGIQNNNSQVSRWQMSTQQGDWASGGSFVGNFGAQDTISFPYSAAKAGTYKFTVTFRSGNTGTAFSYSEPSGKITAGTVPAGNNAAGTTKTLDFNVVVTKPGSGTLVITGTSSGTNDMMVDKFDVELVSIDEANTTYSELDPFVFPSEIGQTKTLEAEKAILYESNPSERWQLEVKNDSSASWASGNAFLNSIGVNDTVSIPYVAQKVGKYEFTITYRSGSNSNGLSWSEPNGKITAGSETIGAPKNDTTKTKTFVVVVEKAGAGTLVFTAPQAGGPQTDKFDIRFIEEAEPEREALAEIINPTPLVGIRNGATRNEIYSQLPETVGIRTKLSQDYRYARVSWDIIPDGADIYDPDLTIEQRLTLWGTVTLPEDVHNPDDISTRVSIEIHVVGLDDLERIEPILPSGVTDVFVFENGTDLDTIIDALPKKANLITGNGTSTEIDITWGNFRNNNTYDQNSLTHYLHQIDSDEVTLPDGLNNSSDMPTHVTINLHVLANMEFDEENGLGTIIKEITVANGISIDDIMALIPSTIIVRSRGGVEKVANISWSGLEDYDMENTQSGEYTLTGLIEEVDEITNQENIPELLLTVYVLADGEPDPDPVENKYTVVFDSMEGTPVDSEEYTEGSFITEPENQPVKSGFKFDGWYKDNEYREKWDFENDILNSNLILYAKWVADKGGTGDGGEETPPSPPSRPSRPSTPSRPSSTTATVTPAPAPTNSALSNSGTGATMGVNVVSANGNATVSGITASGLNAITTSIGRAVKSIDINVSTGNTGAGAVKSVTLIKPEASQIAAVLTNTSNMEDYLTVKTDNASVKIDGAALSTIASTASANEIQIVVEDVVETNLAGGARLAIASLNAQVGKQVEQTFEAYVTSGGRRISSFGNGTVTVGKLDFKIPTGRNPKYYHVYYLDNNGIAVKHPSWYENGAIYFNTNHFSEYAVVYDTTAENGVSDEVFKLYNKATNETLLTTTVLEVTELTKQGWVNQGSIGKSLTNGQAVYRVFNPQSGEHLYTAERYEVLVLTTQYGWNLEYGGKPMYYVSKSANASAGATTAVYRGFNAKKGAVASHSYAIEQTGSNQLTKDGYALDNNGAPVYYLTK